MIKVFYGDDRVRAKAAIKDFLGENYEILDGADIDIDDLPSIFFGASLLSSDRSILIRDFAENKAIYNEFPKFIDSPHKIILFESKLDKRSTVYKVLNDKIEFREFVLPKNPNLNLVFDIYRTAKHDGLKAVAMLEKIKQDEDPIMFFGLLASQTIKDFSARQGTKEKKILKELSKVDLQIKTTKVEPWLLIESFLLRLFSLS